MLDRRNGRPFDRPPLTIYERHIRASATCRLPTRVFSFNSANLDNVGGRDLVPELSVEPAHPNVNRLFTFSSNRHGRPH